MTWEAYADLLAELGYEPAYFKMGSLLRHYSNRRLPRVHPSRKRDGFVFFVVSGEELQHFPEILWRRIAEPAKSGNDYGHTEIAPKASTERAAFADLSKRCLTRPATYRT